MYDLLVLQKLQTSQDLPGKAAYELQRKALEGVRTHELVQIDAQARSDNAQMRSKVERRCDGQRRVVVVRILRSVSTDSLYPINVHTHSLSLFRMLTSTSAC